MPLETATLCLNPSWIFIFAADVPDGLILTAPRLVQDSRCKTAALHHRRGCRWVCLAVIGHGLSSGLACAGVPDPGPGAPPAVAPAGAPTGAGRSEGDTYVRRRSSLALLKPHLGVQCIVSTWAQSVPGPGLLDALVLDHDCLTARTCRLPFSTGDCARSHVRGGRHCSGRATAPAPAPATSNLTNGQQQYPQHRCCNSPPYIASPHDYNGHDLMPLRYRCHCRASRPPARFGGCPTP
jgi:hypothetical protein